MVCMLQSVESAGGHPFHLNIVVASFENSYPNTVCVALCCTVLHCVALQCVAVFGKCMTTEELTAWKEILSCQFVMRCSVL